MHSHATATATIGNIAVDAHPCFPHGSCVVSATQPTQPVVATAAPAALETALSAFPLHAWRPRRLHEWMT